MWWGIFNIDTELMIKNLMVIVKVKFWKNCKIVYQVGLISEDKTSARGGIRQYVDRD